MHRTLFSILLFLIVFALTTQCAFAQSVSFIPNAGISKDMRSKTSNRWNLGFDVGLNGFLSVAGPISIGGRVAYHSWGADGQGWADDYVKDIGGGYTYNLESSSGSQSLIEIVPSARYALLPAISPVQLDLQVGVGLFLVGSSDVSISGSYRSAFSTGHANVTFSNSSMTGVGGQVGLPLTFAGRIQILPLYTLYSAGGDLYHHITLNAGVVL